jgi:2-iminobutanoate/2-iminopropanoate deaminase
LAERGRAGRRAAGTAATDIRRVAVPGLETAGAPYAHIVTDAAYAFLAGIVASDVPGGAAAHGDIARETEIVMAAVRAALAQVGLGIERVVRVDVHLTEIARMPEFDRVYRRVLPERRLSCPHLHPVGRPRRQLEPRDHGDGAAVTATSRPRLSAT